MDSAEKDDRRLLAALAHDDFFLRSMALPLLAEAPKPSIEATRTAIAAIEKYGPRKAFEYPHQIGSLPHDADSLAWAVGYCNSIRENAGDDTFPSHLAYWIAGAPAELLVDCEVPAAAPFGRLDPAGLARRRLELATASAEDCLALIDEGVGKIAEIEGFPHDVINDLEHVCERLAAAATRDELGGRVLAWLREDFDFDGSETGAIWYAGFGIKLAGLLSLEEAIPELLEMYAEEWDWWDEAISKALVSMDCEAALSKAIEAYPDGNWHLRNYLSGVLEKLRLRGFDTEIAGLVAGEEDEDLRGNLGVALASYGTEESMAHAHRIYDESPDDPERFRIVEILYLYRTIQGEDSPQLQSWRAEQERNRKRSLDGMKNFEAKFAKYFAGAPVPAPPPILAPPLPVGRNAPCPCGSGKKYKKCCLGKEPA